MKFTGMEKVGELIQLNMLFILCSLPVVTAGASAAALNYALWRRSEGMGNVTRDFLTAFRENFRRAAVLWVCVLLLAAGLGLNFWLVSAWTGPAYFPAMVLLVVGTYVLMTWSATAFLLLPRFSGTVLDTAKNALIIALGNPIRVLPAAVLNVAPFVLVLLLPELFLLIGFLWLFLLCTVNALVAQKLFGPVFSRLERALRRQHLS